MHVSNTESYVVTGHQDVIKYWSNNTKECVFELEEAHNGNIFSTRITPDEKYIVSTSRDNTVKIWDINMRSLLISIEHDLYKVDSNISKICISPNSQYAIFGSKEGHLFYYDIQRLEIEDIK